MAMEYHPKNHRSKVQGYQDQGNQKCRQEGSNSIGPIVPKLECTRHNPNHVTKAYKKNLRQSRKETIIWKYLRGLTWVNLRPLNDDD